MLSILVAFPKLEDAEKIKNLLIRSGFEVDAVCTTGAQVVSVANELDGGIVICGYRLPDMLYRELNGYLPKGFELLLVASRTRLSENTDGNLVSLELPLKTKDLINTLQLMTYRYNRRKKREGSRPKQRSEEEREKIIKAKLLLMERNNMSEDEAYRYIQKTSMDSGTNMTEMAEMILTLM